MTFADPLAGEFRAMFSGSLRGLHASGQDTICRAVAGVSGFDLEVPASLGGLELGLVASTQLYCVLGAELVDVAAVEATTAAIDLLATHERAADHALAALRAGDALCLPEPAGGATPPGDAKTFRLRPGTGSTWSLAGEAGDVAGLEPPAGWHERRLLRHAAYLTGLADAAFAAAADHCRKREVAGEPLRARQLVADRLVRQLLAVRLAWAATQDAAVVTDRGLDPSPAPGAHGLARRAALTTARGLLQLLGARGLTDRSAGPLIYRLAQRETQRFGTAAPPPGPLPPP